MTGRKSMFTCYGCKKIGVPVLASQLPSHVTNFLIHWMSCFILHLFSLTLVIWVWNVVKWLGGLHLPYLKFIFLILASLYPNRLKSSISVSILALHSLSIAIIMLYLKKTQQTSVIYINNHLEHESAGKHFNLDSTGQFSYLWLGSLAWMCFVWLLADLDRPHFRNLGMPSSGALIFYAPLG